MKITLACITGNCEKTVERFLDVFQPHVDEVVMVRAIGCLEPDRTLEIAKKRGCLTGEYRNGETAKGWPHVDDFAAARNAACDLATGDWLMWADLDDIATGMEQVREILAQVPADCPLVKCPYVVSEQGVEDNFRERFWRAGVGAKWHNALHENLIVPGNTKAYQTREIRIIHACDKSRTDSMPRNLRILGEIEKDRRTLNHTFYYACELARAKDPQAIEVAKEYLAAPDGGNAERFELFMVLADMAETLDQKAALYHSAWTEDPGRAEALYELCNISLCCDNPELAMKYARAMMACVWPEKRSWNHRAMFYGFFRRDLYWQALRSTGEVLRADTERHIAMVEAGRPIITLAHATRGRALMASRCRRDWLATAENPERIDHIFAIDADDEESLPLMRFPCVIQPNGQGGPVAAWNAAARASKGNIIIQLSDDWKPFKGWDTAIEREFEAANGPAVLAVNDGHRKDDLLCMAILNRERLIQQGYMFHPEFFSMYSDNWFSECAFRDGVVIDARDRITFEHMHPAFGAGQVDETYSRTNDGYLYQTGEGIAKRIAAGQTVSAELPGWFDFRDLYDEFAKALTDGGTFTEVGAWKGKSIIYLRDRLDDIGKHETAVEAVDTFEGDEGTGIESVYEEYARNVGSREIVTHKSTSLERAEKTPNGSRDIVFIDAAHDHESAMNDIRAWWPKVRKGGILAGHDADCPGVTKAIDEFAILEGLELKQKSLRCWLFVKP
jgi:glycosyltransferase involved in cell wall biosynthesis